MTSAVADMDLSSNAHRTVSIDSTNSSLNKPPSRQGGRAYQDSTSVDVAAIVAAAGSAEDAISKLWNEKQQATSHNAQLWRLVEKQRAMVLGLNKDLEKALQEKERYRKKYKDALSETSSGSAARPVAREDSPRERKPSTSPQQPAAGLTVLPLNIRGTSSDSRKISDASSEPIPHTHGRSDTPQDANMASAALSASPTSPVHVKPAAQTSSRDVRAVQESNLKFRNTPPTSPGSQSIEHKYADSLTLPTSPLKSPQSLASPKSANRKAPPAPLQLSPPLSPPTASITNNIIDPSDSDYEEEDGLSARAEQMLRGRRKTREDDDREREMAAVEEAEHRSRSKKEKKSKSKSKAVEGTLESSPPLLSNSVVQAQQFTADAELQSVGRKFSEVDDPAAILRQRVQAQHAPKSAIAPALLSPGLPMSPRPGDRPMNSPLPRAPNKSLGAIPMSPRSGFAGMPLSPRAPKQPLPLPPQTPRGFTSPHLARAEVYAQQENAQHASIAGRLDSIGSEKESSLNTATSNVKTPGEVYKGLVTNEYPDLLLPPNALPSIVVKTSSSRLRPSRQSYIAPKNPDENPVLTLAVHERNGNRQLWRVEKTISALATLDGQVRAAFAFRERLPDKALFAGHAPARIDARRLAIDMYFDSMLEAVTEDASAIIICKFLSMDAIGADESADYFHSAASAESRPDTPPNKITRPQRAGYLTKRGKNFGGWKARYFVLDGPSLRYFEAPGGAHVGCIKLHNAQIGKQSQSTVNPQEDEDSQFRHAFLILEPKKKDSNSLIRHVLCAESDEERDAWVDDLLQYVDVKEEDESMKVAHAGIKIDTVGPRSPKLQKSHGDMRPPSRTKPEALRGFNYNDVVAGNAPKIVSKIETPSPSPSPSAEGPSSHPSISGPRNLTVISKGGESWGLKSPPTPKDGGNKKRSMFSAFRGRSSSELAPDKTSPGSPESQVQRAVFGLQLSEAVTCAQPSNGPTDLPAVVYRCLEYLIVKNAILEEGLFRLSGSNTVIKALKDRFNSEGDVDLVNDPNYYDVHAVASLLKLYLRELPSSVLTREVHLEFLQCLEMVRPDMILALNVLVNKLPTANRALLEALSSFLRSVVNHAGVNKMTTRNVAIIFAPTLNVPATLLIALIDEHDGIFGEPVDEASSPISPSNNTASGDELRSPRKQMFTDLPTPAYNQTTFQSLNIPPPGGDTGMIPMRPAYSSYQVAPRDENGFASLNDALRSPSFQSSTANGVATPRDDKARRRESGFHLSPHQAISKKTSQSKLREEDSNA